MSQFIYVDQLGKIHEISHIELSDVEMGYRAAKGINLTKIDVLPSNFKQIWDFATESWIEDIEALKASKIAEITAKRDAFMYADVEYNGSFFINSQVSGNNLTAEIATQTPLIEWLDSNGNQVDLTLEQAKELSALIKAKRRTGYFQEAILIAAINACTTLEELNNINTNFS